MVTAWRLTRPKYADTAFTGEGAARMAGRWNSRGTYTVYTSATLSLAALENLVHLPITPELTYVSFRVEFPVKLLRKIELSDLPPNWRAEPSPQAARSIGDAWVQSRVSAVLQVPSVIIPGENNYLLNPAHPDFPQIKRYPATPFAYDPRLIPERLKASAPPATPPSAR